ncbi:MAG: hypothetical protein Q4Q23_06015, partial [Methanobacteriaceae archaeon]|nr:hypothetical protein [Methanobacteriaceae archaeon]
FEFVPLIVKYNPQTAKAKEGTSLAPLTAQDIMIVEDINNILPKKESILSKYSENNKYVPMIQKTNKIPDTINIAFSLI